MRRSAVVAAALAIALEITALAAHEHARGEWARERAALGTDRYDAARSDAAWNRARSARTIAERIGIAGAIVVVIAAAGSRGKTPGPTTATAATTGATPASERHPLRVLAATAIDALALASAVALSRALAPLPRSPAVSDALALWIPALALAAAVALLVRGATPGAALARSGERPTRPAAAVVAALLLLPAAPIALVAAALGARSERWLAPHVSLARALVAARR